jgi:tetraacyldisaccharide 4'-kinase
VAHRIAGAHFLSTGYGGSLAGPVKVDARRDTYDRVGDEALLLADIAPCWVAKDRVAGARAAARHGARCLVLDDGFQDPVLRHDIALVVVDGHVGFGNGRCMPAGPLREPIAAGLRRADAVVLLGEDRRGAVALCGDLPVLRATLEPEAEASALAGRPVIAFAGIGRPQKFFHTLEKIGADVVEAYAFDDHHPYHPHEIGELQDEAAKRGASLVTTTKDIVRVPPRLRDTIAVLRMTVTWRDEAALLRLLAPVSAEP